jgi:virginiamycin B lyase
LRQYSLPNGSTGPSQLASDAKGGIWFVEQGSDQIGHFDPQTRAFSEFDIPTPDSLPEGIAVDPSGEVWFDELASNGLGVLFPGNGTIREVTIPSGPDGLGCGPVGVTPQGNGSYWIACEFSNQLDEYVPSQGVLKQFDLPVPLSAPLQILFDRSGNLWFTAADAGMLGTAELDQLRPGTTDGITEFAPLNESYVTTIVNPLLPSGSVRTSLAVPSVMALSTDGSSLWISEHGGGSFDRYGIDSKTLTKYFTSLPSSSLYAQSLPNGIAVDASGYVWVAEHYGNRIAEFSPSTGSMLEYPVPCCRSEIAGTLYLTTGANGTVWFTENFGNAIGELSPAGTSAPFVVSTTPNIITLGSTGGAELSVNVSPGPGGVGGLGALTLGAAGVSRSGTLENVTARFGPLERGADGTGESATLTLESSGLRPGSYYITVGATSTTGLISSSVLVVTVTQGSLVVWVALAAALGAAAAVLLLLFRRKSSKRRHGSTSLAQGRQPVIPVVRPRLVQRMPP